ncbi:type I polyketide synthase [Paenibacillus sp. YYML68]|uniref:type I polyketide synthase n=1 Tax=Paenibacillus sp. YYML68 TaxID=2909250 RepID=UPI0024932505|nr:type I polyketide synthase [Paenibacillus sp. YYML68]
MATSQNDAQLRGIAVIGMAGRFPGASDLNHYWDNLKNGTESITFFKEPEPNRINAAGIVADYADFDADFFGMTPREAEITDPQQRIFLECAYEALESAGYRPTACPDRVGVYGGCSQSEYLHRVLSHRNLVESIGHFQIMIGNSTEFFATRVSHKLNLRGPSVTVQTACSSSLVAVHMACQALLTYECDMALAGGLSIKAEQTEGSDYQEGGIHSPDGHCRAFDASAQGTVIGNGGGVVLLKRLVDAVQDGDPVLAVIQGSAINNDGADKVGFTAPSITRQAEVIMEALAVADVHPETIGYVEAHGTGTPLGDPIEVAALTDAYRAYTKKQQYCALGSVKTNIGHLDSGAGIAGLIKAVLSIQHGLIPPSLHYTTPNPKIDFNESPFYVNAELSSWSVEGHPRRAAVSSFGIGGTNAHVIVEEAPTCATSTNVENPGNGIGGPQLLPLSAKSAESLKRNAVNLLNYLRSNPEVSLADAAYTLVRKEPFALRMAIVAETTDAAIRQLEEKLDRPLADTSAPQTPAVFFLFSGQGSQYVNMGSTLYEQADSGGKAHVYRETVDQCAVLLKPQLGIDLRQLLYPSNGSAPEETSSRLNRTAMAQPALFVVEYAMAKQMEAWGIRPQAMLGHSIGEYVAACLAGVMSLEDALILVAARGRLMQEMAPGAMLAVSLPEAELRLRIAAERADLSIAAINSPGSCVVSGSFESIESFEEALALDSISCKRLVTSHAYHSAMMEPMLGRYEDLVRRIRLQEPRIPYVSNITGCWITVEQAMDPLYWVKHVREAVRFSDGIDLLLHHEGPALFVEIGPGQVLTSLARQHFSSEMQFRAAAVNTFPTAVSSSCSYASALRAIGELWQQGVQLELSPFGGGSSRRVLPLPTYAFDRKTLKVDNAKNNSSSIISGSEAVSGSTGWYYSPMWKQSAIPVSPARSHANNDSLHTCLIFQDLHGIADSFRLLLIEEGHTVITVLQGDAYRQIEEDVFVINPQDHLSYEKLFMELSASGKLPRKLIHLWNLDIREHNRDGIDEQQFDYIQQMGLYSLMHIAKGIGITTVTEPIEIIVLTRNLFSIAQEQMMEPERATMLGALRVIPQEYGQLNTRIIDVDGSDLMLARGKRLIERLFREIREESSEFIVAYRGKNRFIQGIEKIELPVNDAPQPMFQEGGVYLIAGAASDLGMSMCETLTQTMNATFLLLGDVEDESPIQVERIRKLEQPGCSRVQYVSADWRNEVALNECIRQAEAAHGGIKGVLFITDAIEPGLIQLQDCEASSRVLLPQVLGMSRLAAVLLKQRELDWILLFSSGISLTGGVGQMNLCAANQFADMFAAYLAHQGLHAVSINWSMWQEGDWLEKQGNLPAPLKEQLQRMYAEYGLSVAEGIDAMKQVVAGDFSQVIVSKQNIFDLHQQWIAAVESLPEAAEIEGGGEFVAPRTVTEKKIAEIWEALFGLQNIGVQQSFFEIGGNSLVSIQLVARLRQTFHGDIPMDVIFEAPTIEKLALSIEAKQVSQKELEELERMLSEIEELHPDDLSQLIGSFT